MAQARATEEPDGWTETSARPDALRSWVVGLDANHLLVATQCERERTLATEATVDTLLNVRLLSTTDKRFALFLQSSDNSILKLEKISAI